METCTPTTDFENQMKQQCPDKTLLNDLSNGWTKHEVGHSRMGKCNCKEEGSDESKEKGENLSRTMTSLNFEKFQIFFKRQL